MKTFLLPLLVLFFLVISCSNGSNDLDRSGLKGHVKSVTEHQFEATSEDGRWVAGKPNLYGNRITNYDRDGLYVETIAINQRGDTTGISKCRRENGEMVEETFHSIYGDRTTRTLFERISDEQVNFEVWDGEQLYTEGANYYDSKGRLLQQVRVVNDQEVINHNVYEKGLLTETYQEEMSGERTFTQQYDYEAFDDEGNWTTKLIYVGEDKIKPGLVTVRKLEYY
ncbi:MAG: hypothetical protein KAR19_19605 [Bacteroidales bacterium]|nr:hypothetical protein [Bacteroidales bacterium]